jgi:hypothetical protein
VADIVAAYETNSDKSAARLRGVKRRD